MALTYLLSRLRHVQPNMTVADNPIARIEALIVDHGLREGSNKEARSVMGELAKMKGVSPHLATINWQQELGPDADPKNMSNLESAARHARYRKLAALCIFRNVESLFLAHHQDDQYETVLMRLLAGHRSRGLLGMRPAADIPECYDLHAAYQSGYVDDQLRDSPYISFRPHRRELKRLKGDLLSRVDPEVLEREIQEGLRIELDIAHVEREFGTGLAGGTDGNTGYFSRKPQKHSALLPIHAEDGGIALYRPLLEFGKDRIIATCEANKIKWFEDHTNHDPTLTPRNAIRYISRNHTLPMALQKPAILRLSARCAAKAWAQEAEADRVLDRTIIQDFNPNIGTLIVRLPRLSIPRARRSHSIYAACSKDLRIHQARMVAALYIRKLIACVTPETNLPLLSNLQSTVSRLFPPLANATELPKMETPPRAFNLAGMMFAPIQTPASADSRQTQTWFLTREPYPSNQPTPTTLFNTENESTGIKVDIPTVRTSHRRPRSASPRWMPWRLFDGRFWIRIRRRVKNGRVYIAPFNPAFAKPFRLSLDERSRENLPDLLKRHAPGKVRYTLPALYIETTDNTDVETLETGSSSSTLLLALPTIAIHVPGLERWLQYDVRYKKVDCRILERNLSTFSQVMSGEPIEFLEPPRRLPRLLVQPRSKISRHRRRAKTPLPVFSNASIVRKPRYAFSGSDSSYNPLVL
jgi:tRNA(Ile)-lysidine synthase